jgi:hypothetical protein
MGTDIHVRGLRLLLPGRTPRQIYAEAGAGVNRLSDKSDLLRGRFERAESKIRFV